jgi:UDP-N-acetylglucosamine 2-epimerase (non-hydrolysing)
MLCLPRAPTSATIGTPKQGGKLRQYRIALVVGTRPEAIKLSPIAHALANLGEPPGLVITGQHPGLELAGHRLDGFETVLLGCPGQPDPMLHADLVRAALNRTLPISRPELLIVQGDTSSALGGALAASELGIPLAHVEAGLRTHDPNLPWPEEENRVAIDRLSDLMFAPTSGNAANLRREQLSGRVHITGNSGIDALAGMFGPLPLAPPRRWLPRRQFKLLVTCHRRENWAAGLEGLATALLQLVEHKLAADVILPPNPGVTERMHRLLGGKRGISLIPPLSHAATIAAMRAADLVLSDSGGMQEEAPALGVPLLILRDKTERPEGLVMGTMELVGTDTGRIVAAVERLRRDRRLLREMARPCLPFGDGQSAPRIAQLCIAYMEEMAAARQSCRA